MIGEWHSYYSWNLEPCESDMNQSFVSRWGARWWRSWCEVRKRIDSLSFQWRTIKFKQGSAMITLSLSPFDSGVEHGLGSWSLEPVNCLEQVRDNEVDEETWKIFRRQYSKTFIKSLLVVNKQERGVRNIPEAFGLRCWMDTGVITGNKSQCWERQSVPVWTWCY